MAHKLVVTAYGEPADVVRLIEAPDPTPGPGQVVVATRAIGMNPADVKTIRGQMGADESRLPLPLGFEAAGVVTAIGEHAHSASGPISVGDDVIVYRAVGAYTDVLLADATAVHHRPSTLDAEHAAGLLLVGVTAADLVATAAVQPSDVVLVHGGSGAVGSIAVQLAVSVGATVVATAGAANQDHVAALGATPVVYGEGLLDRVRTAATGPVTAVLDTVGTDEAIDVSLQLVDNPGKIVSVAAFGRAADGIVVLNGSTPQSKQNRAAAIDDLIADAAAGRLATEVAKTFPLADAPTALTELATTHPRGKFVLLP
ncbi:NADP-dependent oxidoreductase [Gordonia sp. CPCC 205515]|uniref:NADP-dependent oxidoreductase n=1 Tax=Gordonia sp. CPCC 205515 TaxID=3140791 RepID=UPI003AF38230